MTDELLQAPLRNSTPMVESCLKKKEEEEEKDNKMRKKKTTVLACRTKNVNV